MEARTLFPLPRSPRETTGAAGSTGSVATIPAPSSHGQGTIWPNQPTAVALPLGSPGEPRSQNGHTNAAVAERKARVLLIDDHASLREPLAVLLDQVPGLCVAGQAGSVAETRRLLMAGLVADVVVLDLNLPDGEGINLIKELRAANAFSAILVLTASSSRLDQARSVQAGAKGVLPKTAPIATIIEAITRLGAGLPAFPAAQTVELLRLANEERERAEDIQVLLKRLTPREREVLASLSEGLSDKEIALRLHVSSKTVRVHMANILDKLGLESRLQALIFAVRHGIVEIE